MPTSLSILNVLQSLDLLAQLLPLLLGPATLGKLIMERLANCGAGMFVQFFHEHCQFFFGLLLLPEECSGEGLQRSHSRELAPRRDSFNPHEHRNKDIDYAHAGLLF